MKFKDIGFDLWCDFVERDFVDNEFGNLLQSGLINGATSNPSIFEASFRSSNAYNRQKKELDGTQKQKYEALAIEDIKKAASKLLPLYEKNNSGFVSIEVDPTLCDDSFGTIEEGARLFKAIGMPNVMIKVPATEAGYLAMRELSGMGININATLVFSPEQAKRCFEVINEGMQQTDKISHAVISIFVSRFDRKVDDKLDVELRGKLGIANAMSCYKYINDGGNSNIKPLFASTGVKGDKYPQDYYVKELLLPHAVNTAPLDTLKYFIDVGKFKEAELLSYEDICDFMAYLNKQGVNIEMIYSELLKEGLDAFKESFKKLLSSL